MNRLMLGINALVTDENGVQVQAVDEDQYVQVSARGGPPQYVVAASVSDEEIVFGVSADILVLFTSGELTIKLNDAAKNPITVNGLYVIQGHTVSKIFVTNAATTTTVTIELLAVKSAA